MAIKIVKHVIEYRQLLNWLHVETGTMALKENVGLFGFRL